jgi:serine protease inhibitor
VLGETMKTYRVARVATASALVALTACSAPALEVLTADGVERVSVDGSAYAAEVRALRTSAFWLGAALLADGGDDVGGANGNVVSSPGSLLIALSMLRAGASGETAAEMDHALHLPAENRDEAMNAVLASLGKFDGDPGTVDEANPPQKPVMHLANGLFVDKDVPTGEPYLGVLSRHYGIGVYPVDFKDEGATKPAIDAWVNTNTGGRIKEAPAAYDRRNTFSLINAVYFASAWETPFDPADTSDLPFTTADGQAIEVPTMHNEVEMKYAEGPLWRGVDLPYADGFVMRLVLPEAGSAAFNPETLTEIADALDTAPLETVQIQLPRWDRESSFDLRKVFTSLGLHTMLNTTRDFNTIQTDMAITQAAQAANVTVAEKGTIAAAVTQINAAETSAAPMPELSIDFDRPFHYQIVHTASGLPLFMGTVADPRPRTSG